MTTHIIAVTYKPKIAGVRDGTIRQTIRPGWGREVGDKVLLHGWAGRPYWSKWSWRRDEVLNCITNVIFTDESLFVVDTFRDDGKEEAFWFPWCSSWCDSVAKEDGIFTANGYALKAVLEGYGATDGDRMQILRW
jgi:hypothetical protein